MRTFYTYIKSFVSEHYETKLYLFFAFITGSLICLNYVFDFEDSHLKTIANGTTSFLAYSATHAVGYYSIILLLFFYRKDKSFIRSWEFWLKSLIIIFAFGFDRSLRLFDYLSDFPGPTRVYLHRTIKNVIWLITILIPITTAYFIWDRKQLKNLYGLTVKGVYFKPYFSLLLIIIPLTFFASFSEGFQIQYPSYKAYYGTLIIRNGIMPEWLTIVVYEACYLFDFIPIELIFRGFLIHSMIRLLGKDVILPMAAMYAVIHFGKPPGETISSVFGGYILGVISYYSKNIWGGVFVHMGLAFFMEFFAFIQIHYM